MSTLDFLADAVNRFLDSGDWQWTWFHVMTSEDRLRFDGFLVQMDDELAYQAGLPQHRFELKVRRMAALERQRRQNKGQS